MQLTSENYYSQEANKEYMSVSGYKDFAGTYGKMPCEFYGIEIWNEEDGPIARITVCIAGSGLAEDETVIDTNNCPWAMEFIEQHGFGQATGRMVRSGYCTYPVVKLDIEKIGEYLEVA